MNQPVAFGEHIRGYGIRVLNEREVRAAAGLLFVLMFTAILDVVFRGDFLLLKYAILIFLTDILIRVFASPRFSPFLIVGRLIVRNQVPEYVGAQQKYFAWIIGTGLATVMFIHVVLLNARGPIAGVLCFTCLIFLFFESAFGICLGCKFYSLLHKEQAQYCPGEACAAGSREAIQHTSKAQLIIVLGFIVYIATMVFALNDSFRREPHDLFVRGNSLQAP